MTPQATPAGGNTRAMPVPAEATGPRDTQAWRSSGSPYSPAVTWEPAPALGWAQVRDHMVGGLQGIVEGGVGVVTGFVDLVSSPAKVIEAARRPIETLERAGEAMQQQAREAFTAARQGHFEPAGRLHGEQLGSAAVAQGMAWAGARVSGTIGRVANDSYARHVETRARQQADAEALRDARIDNNHGRDGELNLIQTLMRHPMKLQTELTAAAEARRLEVQQGGHSLDRHGPQLTPAHHQRRVGTGVAADHVFSPTHTSTQFHSYNDWLASRQKALAYVELRYGVQMHRAPSAQLGQQSKYIVILEHTRAIDAGVVGVGPSHTVRVGHKQGKGYAQTQSIDGVTRTKTVVAWSATQGQWQVVQHMPWAEGWNNATKTFDPTIAADVTGVRLFAGDPQ